MAGLGGPTLEAYAGGYDPDRYHGRPARDVNEVYYNPKDWSEDDDEADDEEEAE